MLGIELEIFSSLAWSISLAYNSSNNLQEECQWKWQCNEIEDVLCIKTNDRKYEECKQDNSNERKKADVCTDTKETLSMQCYGVIKTFSKGELTITDNNKKI